MSLSLCSHLPIQTYVYTPSPFISLDVELKNFSQIVEDAEAEFLTFFATKTIGSIRAPDEFVYPAPFNLVELFIAPFE